MFERILPDPDDSIKTPIIYSNSEDRYIETHVVFANNSIDLSSIEKPGYVQDPFLYLDAERTKKISSEELMQLFAKGMVISIGGVLLKPVSFVPSDVVGAPYSFVIAIGKLSTGGYRAFTSEEYVNPGK